MFRILAVLGLVCVLDAHGVTSDDALPEFIWEASSDEFSSEEISREIITEDISSEEISSEETKSCLSGWTKAPSGEICYQVTRDKLKQSQAAQRCAGFGGRLAEPKTNDHNEALRQLAGLKDKNLYWIGLDDIQTEGTFVWGDGSVLAWSSWKSGQPDNKKNNEDCVAFRPSGGTWLDAKCEARLYSLCQRELDPPECEVDYGLNVQVNVDTSTVVVGVSVTYTCEDGYVRLSGDEIRTCQNNGNMSGDPLICIKDNCPSGWTKAPIGEICYQVYRVKRTQSQAEERCAGLGGRLAEPKTNDHNEALRQLAGLKDKNLYLIGLDDKQTEGTFVWGDGSVLAWSSWKSGQPDNRKNKEDCVGLRPSDGKWLDTKCGSRFYSLCQLELDIDPPECILQNRTHIQISVNTSTVRVGVSVTYTCKDGYVRLSGDETRTCQHNGNMSGDPLVCIKDCPPGWTRSADNDKCYKLYENLLPYDEAESECDKMLAKLAMPKKPNDVSLFKKLIKIKTYFWIGLRDEEKKREFIWADGETLGSWTNWEAGEPNNDKNREFCVSVHSRRGSWYDMRCESRKFYACEIQLNDDVHSECAVEPVLCGTASTDRQIVPLGASVTFTCNEGCESKTGADVTRTCQVDGQLSGLPLDCALSCDSEFTSSEDPDFCYKSEPVVGPDGVVDLHVKMLVDGPPSQQCLTDIDNLLLNSLNN